MLASDLNNPQFSGAQNPDSLLHVVFYMRTEQDNYKSEKEGRPIFYEVPYIRITTPGNNLMEIDAPAREDHKNRFPQQWASFQNSVEPQNQIVGTTVENWPVITRAEAEELKGLKFFTVEQLAGASDLQVQRLGMGGHVLRQKAKAYLETAKDTALQQHQAAELARKEEQISSLQAQLDSLNDRFEKMMQASNKPKRKYTRRVKEEQVSPDA